MSSGAGQGFSGIAVDVDHNPYLAEGAGTVDAVDKDVVTVTFEKGQKKLKQEFLKPATAGGGSGQLKVGDRLAHPRYGNGVVKYVDGSGVTTIFGNLTLLLPPVEAARMKL